MKLHPTQFGVPGSTASPRQHAPRLAVNYSQSQSNGVSQSLRGDESSPQVPGAISTCEPSLAEAANAATGGEGRARAERSAQASTLKPSQESKPAFETLIGSPEAAKLLGNIHVKTLQRYARKGSLPGYQIGGHWYFRVSELDAWLQSRINSNCQPADRVDFTQEKTQ